MMQYLHTCAIKTQLRLAFAVLCLLTWPRLLSAQIDNNTPEQLLAQARVDPSASWLQIGESIVLAFWQSDLSGQPVGALLILHDEDSSPLTPHHLLNLQRYLPRHGWATLSVSMPALPQVQPTARQTLDETTSKESKPDLEAGATDDSPEGEGPATTPDKTQEAVNTKDETEVVYQDQEAKEITASEDKTGIEPEGTTEVEQKIQHPTVEEIEAQAMARIDAGIKYLQEQGQYNIVVLGEGSGALRALQFLSTVPAEAPPAIKQNAGSTNRKAIISRSIRAAVVLNLQNNYPRHQAKPLELLPALRQTPLFDIYTSPNRDYRSQAKARRQLTKQQKFELFKQNKVISQTNESQDSEFRLTKTIRGFLERYAAGKEL